LREEEIHRAVLSFFEDGGRQFGGITVADLNIHAALLLVLLEDWSHQLFAAPGVDDQRTFARL
jgi:hypothetical protein